MAGATLDLAFGLAQRFVEIENDAAYRRSFVGALKVELRPYAAEPWYERCIAAAQQHYAEFEALWEMEDAAASPTCATVPLALHLPGIARALTFQRVKSPFGSDPRFQMVLWTPLDEATTYLCLAWAREEHYG